MEFKCEEVPAGKPPSQVTLQVPFSFCLFVSAIFSVIIEQRQFKGVKKLH